MTRQTFYCVIPVREETRDILSSIKTERGCTYDVIIRELLAAQYGIPQNGFVEVLAPIWSDK